MSELDNSGDGPLQVPGIGLPLDFELPSNERFSHGLYDFKQHPRLLACEISMLTVINKITDVPNWHRLVFDDQSVAKWKIEALLDPWVDDTDWEWCLAELQDKARTYKEKKHVLVLDAASRICKSDALVPQSIRMLLKAATEPLRFDPGEQMIANGHRRDNTQAHDIVNPSLFALSYGQSRVLSEGGSTNVVNMFPANATKVAPTFDDPSEVDNEIDATWSIWNQWLPCEVEFDDNTDTGVRIASYINNLHPRNKTLYNLIERLISLAIDPWNEVLVSGQQGRTPPRVKIQHLYDPPYPEWARGFSEIQERYEADPESYKQARMKIREYMSLPDRDGYEDESECDSDNDPWLDPEWPLAERIEFHSDNALSSDELPVPYGEIYTMARQSYYNYIDEHGIDETVLAKWRRIRNVVAPNAGASYSYEQWKQGFLFNEDDEDTGNDEKTTHEYYSVDLREDFQDQGLQVVVKLSDTQLTPEKPDYGGSQYQFAGIFNDHIVATAIYCYDLQNVTVPEIWFQVETELKAGDVADGEHEEREHGQIAELFELEVHELWKPDFQYLGSVKLQEGRVIVFPNTLCHRMQPFLLNDKTKPGHCRAIVLHLVDPNYRICSTPNVPPQQHSWWASEGYHKIDFSKLPQEILNMITDEVGEDWPMSMDQAKELAGGVTGERNYVHSMYDTQVYDGEDTYIGRWEVHDRETDTHPPTCWQRYLQ